MKISKAMTESMTHPTVPSERLLYLYVFSIRAADKRKDSS